MWSDPFGALEIVWGNLRYILSALDLIFQSRMIPGLLLPVCFILALGLWWSFNEQSVFFRSYVLLYLALVVAWPFNPQRYLIPLIPAIYFFLFRGVHAAEAHLNDLMTSETRKRSYVTWCELHLQLSSCCMLDGSLTIYSVRMWPLLESGLENDCLQAGEVFQRRLRWIRSHTDDKTILATSYDPMYYLYTGRKAIQPALYNPKTYFYPYGRYTRCRIPC